MLKGTSKQIHQAALAASVEVEVAGGKTERRFRGNLAQFAEQVIGNKRRARLCTYTLIAHGYISHPLGYSEVCREVRELVCDPNSTIGTDQLYRIYTEEEVKTPMTIEAYRKSPMLNQKKAAIMEYLSKLPRNADGSLKVNSLYRDIKAALGVGFNADAVSPALSSLEDEGKIRRQRSGKDGKNIKYFVLIELVEIKQIPAEKEYSDEDLVQLLLMRRDEVALEMIQLDNAIAMLKGAKSARELAETLLKK